MSTQFTCIKNSDLTFRLVITGPAGALSGMSIRSQIRKNAGSPVLATMDSALDNGSVTISVSNNTIDFFIPASITTTFPLGALQFDVFMYASGVQKDIYQGSLNVVSSITEF